MTEQHEQVQWKVKWEVLKFKEDIASLAEAQLKGYDPYERVTGSGNLLMYGGASNIWQYMLGNGTGTGGQTLTFFNNANSYIGIGDSSTAEAATHTDLQAATNKTRIAMDATYPQHTPGTTSPAATVTFVVTAGSGAANFSWQEFGLFNGSTGGRMLNRKVTNLGTKATGSWVLTMTISLV